MAVGQSSEWRRADRLEQMKSDAQGRGPLDEGIDQPLQANTRMGSARSKYRSIPSSDGFGSAHLV